MHMPLRLIENIRFSYCLFIGYSIEKLLRQLGAVLCGCEKMIPDFQQFVSDCVSGRPRQKKKAGKN